METRIQRNTSILLHFLSARVFLLWSTKMRNTSLTSCNDVSHSGYINIVRIQAWLAYREFYELHENKRRIRRSQVIRNHATVRCKSFPPSCKTWGSHRRQNGLWKKTQDTRETRSNLLRGKITDCTPGRIFFVRQYGKTNGRLRDDRAGSNFKFEQGFKEAVALWPALAHGDDGTLENDRASLTNKSHAIFICMNCYWSVVFQIY